MSSIASLHLIKAADLPAIVSAARAHRTWEAVQRFGQETGEGYGWSGHVMVNVLEILSESDVPLESPALLAESEAVNADLELTVLITGEATVFLDRLDPAAYRPGDLLDGPIALELDEAEARAAMTETLELLRDTIARLSDDEVLLLHVG